MAKPKTLSHKSEGTPAPAHPKGTPAPSNGSVSMDLFDRAIKGDESCRGELKALLDDPEGGPLTISLFGDPPTFAQRSVIDGAAGKNLLVKGALQRRMKTLRAELEGPNPTPIERLLAERAAFCWLVVWRYEEHLASANELTFKQGDYHQRRIDAAHRRFLSSVRTLATVRKLALPALQINIGENQVNVAGGPDRPMPPPDPARPDAIDLPERGGQL